MENKSWLEVEADESMRLLRKKLEKYNDCHPDHFTAEDVHTLRNMWIAIRHILEVKEKMKSMK